MDKFTKYMTVVLIALIAVTGYIIYQYENFKQKLYDNNIYYVGNKILIPWNGTSPNCFYHYKLCVLIPKGYEWAILYKYTNSSNRSLYVVFQGNYSIIGIATPNSSIAKAIDKLYRG